MLVLVPVVEVGLEGLGGGVGGSLGKGFGKLDSKKSTLLKNYRVQL